MLNRRVRRLVLAAGLVSALPAAHGIAWAWTVRQLDVGLARWIDGGRADGWAVSVGRTAPAGWPGAAELLVHDLAVASEGGALSWRGDILLRLTPTDHRRLQVQAVGVQRIQVGHTPPLDLAADQAVGLVALDAPGPTEIRVEGLRVEAAWGRLSVASLRGWVTALSAMLEAERIGLPAGAWLPGAAVEAVSLDVVLSGALPAGANLEERARRWQHAGNAVQVRHAAVRWGELDAEGSGTAGLDASLQPRADATLRLRGYAAALDALSGAGLLPGGALAAKAVLSLMARPQADGGGAVDVPLRLQGGVVQAGRIPLLRLPPLDWPAP